MALNPPEGVVLCRNIWRHGPNHQIPAIAYVSDAADPLGSQGVPRCRSCVSSLQSANREVVRAHIDWINPDHNPATDHDDDPTPADLNR
jgi:hypothetical protein